VTEKTNLSGKEASNGMGLGGHNIHALILSPGMAYPLTWNSKSEWVERKYSQIISKPTIFLTSTGYN